MRKFSDFIMVRGVEGGGYKKKRKNYINYYLMKFCPILLAPKRASDGTFP